MFSIGMKRMDENSLSDVCIDFHFTLKCSFSPTLSQTLAVMRFVAFKADTFTCIFLIVKRDLHA